MGKNKLNALNFFMAEKRKEDPELRNKSNEELEPLCSGMWDGLSPGERRKYEEMKRNHDAIGKETTQPTRKKGEVRGDGYDAHGRSLNDIKKRDEDQIKEAELKKSHISRMVMEAVREKRLEQKEFFIIEVNVFCETPEGEILPAEISIAKFSLHDGVIKILHMFIKSGKIPFGYTYIVNDNLEKTHKIELEQKEEFFLDYTPDALEKEIECQKGKRFNSSQRKLIQEAEANRHYKSICEEILKFMNLPVKDRGIGITSRIKLTLFTMPGSVERCEKSLEWLFTQAKFGQIGQNLIPGFPTDHPGQNPWTGYIPNFRILELPQLFHELSNTTAAQQNTKVKKIPAVSVAEHYLEKDSFKFADGMSCNFHRENDEKTDGCGGSDYCTSTAVRRWSYIMADNLCQQYGIKLKGGHHIPKQTDTDQAAQDDPWENLPGLAIFPKPTYHDLDRQHLAFQGGRSANTDIRYRNKEVKDTVPPPDAGKVLHSTNTISEFMEDNASSSGRSVWPGASVESEIADLNDVQSWPSLGMGKKELVRGRGTSTPRGRGGVFSQNAAMTTIIGNQDDIGNGRGKDSSSKK